MTTTTNAENLRQYKSRFSLILEQIPPFPWRNNLARKVKYLTPSFKRIA